MDDLLRRNSVGYFMGSSRPRYAGDALRAFFGHLSSTVKHSPALLQRSPQQSVNKNNKLASNFCPHNAEVWGCLRYRGKSILSMSWPVRLIADTGQFSLGIEFQGDIVFLDPFAIFRAGHKVNLFRITAEAAGLAAELCPDIGP